MALSQNQQHAVGESIVDTHPAAIAQFQTACILAERQGALNVGANRVVFHSQPSFAGRDSSEIQKSHRKAPGRGLLARASPTGPRHESRFNALQRSSFLRRSQQEGIGVLGGEPIAAEELAGPPRGRVSDSLELQSFEM